MQNQRNGQPQWQTLPPKNPENLSELPAPPLYAVDDLLIDVGFHSISRQGAALPLPKLSFDLLLALVRHAPHVVSLDELMREVWPGLVVSPETVSKRVALLRASLGDDSHTPRYIASLRSRGYRLVPPVSQPEGSRARTSPPIPAGHVPDFVATQHTAEPLPLGGPLFRPGWRRALLAAGLVAVVCGGGIYWTRSHPAQRPAVAAQNPSPASITLESKHSIAVLPFADLSEHKNEAYLGDAMAEQILNQLTQVPGLTVIGRASSFQFKGRNEDLRTIGATLNAQYILEGSVRKFGETVRVAAELIDARSGATLWSDTFNRPMRAALELQDAVALDVARKLQITVAPSSLVPHVYARDPQVYDLIQRGMDAEDHYDQTSVDEAEALLQKAVDLDPASAGAVASLALNAELQGEFGFQSPPQAFERARRLAARALTLDPKSVLAYHVLALVHIYSDWDWAAARQDIAQVATLTPDSGDAAYLAAMLSIATGRLDDAAHQLTTALAYAPLRAGFYIDLSIVEMARGNLDQAQSAARRVLAMQPNYAWGHFYLGLVLLARGANVEALREMQLERADDARRQGLAMAYYALKQRPQADAALADIIAHDADENAFGIAETYAFCHQHNEALTWLERAYTQKDPDLKYIKANRALLTLGGEPRYKAVLAKIGLAGR